MQIIFLPPYSPNLNLIERLWRLLKKIDLYNEPYMGGTTSDLLISKPRFLKLLC
ncbi:MAG: transposase [Pseudomonadota bacterium]